MSDDRFLVSIGLPVFNGERFLAETLDSFINQTFPNFELIISDNASTDSTQEICLQYAGKDDRIRYVRQKTNLGASRNYNLLFEMSSGKYFKWASHDDLCAPTYLERCTQVLNQDPSVILCYSRTQEIDEAGQVIREFPAKPKLGSEKTPDRFFECICVPHPQVAVFGLFRSDVLKKTRLIGNYASSDRTLLGELSLLGRFYEIQDFLFFRRSHPTQSYKLFPGRHALQAWYDPQRSGKITFPHWRLLYEHFLSVVLTPLQSQDRLICTIYLAWWIRLHWRYLAKNLILKEPIPSLTG
jgi:glycosyltransferase involved in cell wall biosynthesis